MKMNRKCDAIMNEFMQEDKGKVLPLHIVLHLLFCKECRTKVRYMTQAQKVTSSFIAQKAQDMNFDTASFMKKIQASPVYIPQKNPISLVNWVITGLLMGIFLLTFTFITKNACSTKLMVAFYLIFAGIVTSYVSMFVGCNIDFFVKKIDAHNLNMTL